MKKFAIAVKSFIVDNNKILLIKRRSNDVHKPGSWDIPGGRLDPGEDPNEGMKRETLEEAGINIEILLPIMINHFIRDDGQRITMIIFLCRPKSTNIELSEEHVDHKWIDVNASEESFPRWLLPAVKNLRSYINL